MAAGTDAIGDGRTLALQAAILARPATAERRMADAIRVLAIDAIEAARSGHPGMPMGMADVATSLWTRFHKFDAADPRWPDRDRFVLSAGHGSMLLYALLHLTGHDGMGVGELRRFCQLNSPAAGHPAFGAHPGIETSTGPLGQGIATAVGMALAERMLAARFGRSLVDHRTWVIASDGDLMEGVSHEAASLAGHLRLEKLTVIWDDNAISTDGDTALATSEDTLRRFAAYGWAVKRIDGHDAGEAAAALAMAMRSKKPTLIAARTIIGFAAPTKAGTAATHGVPLGAEEAAGTKEALGWVAEPFELPDGVGAAWHRAGVRGAAARRGWLKRLARHPHRAEFERVMAGRLPDGFHEAIATLKAEFATCGSPVAAIDAGQRVLAALASVMPELAGGSADLSGATKTQVAGIAAVAPGSYAGRYIHFGTREHAMAAAMNGVALHGGMVPYGGSFVVFTDYMRPALRLAAIMRQRVVHVLTHDCMDAGHDGPTHQPVEQLASLRAMPNMCVLRPACAIETVECWELALRRTAGPSLIALSRTAVPTQRTETTENRCARGGYVLAEANGARRATLIASGAEVALALEARTALAKSGMSVAVISLPSWELFAAQDDAYRAAVLGGGLRVGIEAACGFGWERWLGPHGIFIGMSDYGASAPGEDVFRHFGITAEAIVGAVRRRLG